MSKDKCGLSPTLRKRRLKELGFCPDREAAGSHTIWVHAKFAEMKIKVPANMGNAHQPGHISVPDNPAPGTWLAIIKYAEFCNRAANKKNITGSFTKAAAPPPKPKETRRERKARRKIETARERQTRKEKQERRTRKSGVPSLSPA